MKSKILAIIIAGVLVCSLVACGSDDSSESTESESASASETATPSESETTEPSESEDEDRLAPDGVWETDGERVTIEGDTVTIDHIDDEGEVTETYWVGSFELDEDSDTWTSTRDPNAEMTCESETIKFTWAGEDDNVYDKLSYSVTNEDGTTKTVTLDRTESLGDIDKGVVPDFEDSSSGDTAAGTSASPSASNSKNSDTASANDTSASASASTGSNSNNDSSDKSSGNTASSGGNSGSTASNNGSGSTNNNNGSSSSGNSGSGGSGSSGSSNSGTNNNSSNNNSGGSSGTTTTVCSHNYVGDVTKAATCSAAGVKTYTCSKCGASYTESIPATGAHSWQPVYKTVHHDATGHYETVTVSEAYSYDQYICNGCGYTVSTLGTSINEASDAIAVHCIREGKSWTIKTINIPATTQQQWVVDSNAYDEQIVDYYKCSVCGATK